MNTNNLPSTFSIERGLLSLVGTNNIKVINIDIRRITYSGLIRALIRVAIVINTVNCRNSHF